MSARLSDAIAEQRDGAVLAVTVVPRSSTTAIDRVEAGDLRIRVAAPPVEGAANATLIRYLADMLNVPRSNIRLVSGETGRRKRVLVLGVMAKELVQRLDN